VAGEPAQAGRQLREDDPGLPPLHRQLPRQPRRSEGPGQLGAHHRRDKRGDIFTAEFQELLREITDEVFYVNGVDRSALQSLWTPNVRWQEVTEEGFVGGAVIPDDYDGSERPCDKLRDNTLKSGQIGRLVANDFRSAIIVAPLVEVDPNTGERLDYKRLPRTSSASCATSTSPRTSVSASRASPS
jgi:predicted RND superfamily exporter protein